MNIVVFTHQNLKDMPIHEWIDCHAHQVFVIADEEAQSPFDLAFARAKGYRAVKLYSNYINNGAIDADVLELHERYGIDRLIALGEDDVIRAARLRVALGLPGQSLESAVAYRNKGVMKAILERAGVPVAPQKALTSPLDLIEFKQTHGLPIFIKPTSSSGSTDARAIRTEEEFRRFLEVGFRTRIAFSEYVGDLLVEKFVDGQLYHVDGLVIDGQISLIVPSRYLAPSLTLEALEKESALCSRTMDPGEPLHDELCGIVRKTIEALPSPRSFSFHAELFHTVEGDILLNEIASRTGGGKLSSAVRIVSGISLNHLACLAQIDPGTAREKLKQARPVSGCAGFSLISPKDVELIAVPESAPFPWVSDFTVYAPAGHRTDVRKYAAEKIAAAVVSGSSIGEVEARLAELNRWFLTSFTRPLYPLTQIEEQELARRFA